MKKKISVLSILLVALLMVSSVTAFAATDNREDRTVSIGTSRFEDYEAMMITPFNTITLQPGQWVNSNALSLRAGDRIGVLAIFTGGILSSSIVWADGHVGHQTQRQSGVIYDVFVQGTPNNLPMNAWARFTNTGSTPVVVSFHTLMRGVSFLEALHLCDRGEVLRITVCVGLQNLTKLGE